MTTTTRLASCQTQTPALAETRGPMLSRQASLQGFRDTFHRHTLAEHHTVAFRSTQCLALQEKIHTCDLDVVSETNEGANGHACIELASLRLCCILSCFL